MSARRPAARPTSTRYGVRGFSDPRAVKLPNGDPVWKQQWELFGLLPEHVLPFHPPAKDLGLQFLEDLLHDWDTTHCALNNGGRGGGWSSGGGGGGGGFSGGGGSFGGGGSSGSW